MSDEKKTIEATATAATAVSGEAPARGGRDTRGRLPARGAQAGGGRGGRPQRGGGGRERRGGDNRERRSEFEQKVIGMRRVARVMAGGRRFNFSVAMVLGDKKGRVGFGLGKAMDTALAIEKATNDAKKNMINLDLTKTNSLPHDISAKYAASVVAIRPSPGS